MHIYILSNIFILTKPSIHRKPSNNDQSIHLQNTHYTSMKIIRDDSRHGRPPMAWKATANLCRGAAKSIP